MNQEEARRVRNNFDAWALGAAMVVLSIVGVLMASAAKDTVFYASGLTLSLFAVLFVFGIIARTVRRD